MSWKPNREKLTSEVSGSEWHIVALTHWDMNKMADYVQIDILEWELCFDSCFCEFLPESQIDDTVA